MVASRSSDTSFIIEKEAVGIKIEKIIESLYKNGNYFT